MPKAILDRRVAKILAARLESCAEAANLSCDQWGILLAAVLPEWYGARPAPRDPTSAPIASVTRVVTYRDRLAAGVELYHRDDAEDLAELEDRYPAARLPAG
jgi:hypothetical protein